VFDLDGDGVELVALASSVAQFDLNADGFAERTGWVSGDDGILVLDRNANGIVDDGLEVFGMPPVIPTGSPTLASSIRTATARSTRATHLLARCRSGET
jgi:hypothetical protein